MDICKCIHCEHHDVNTKTTFCKLNNESTFTDNDIPCPLEVESDEISKIVHNYINKGIVSDYDRLNCPKPPIYIGPVKVKTLRDRIIEESAKELQNEVDKLILQKEETKMNATSVQVINEVKDMNVTFEKGPFEETRIILSVSTDDDTYEINCSGPGCEKFLRKLNFVPTKEYDYIYNQLMEREKEIRHWKKEAADCLKLRDEAQKEAYKLKKENERIKENLHSQHEMIMELNQKNLELKELKTPTIENFADEEPSSRSDILNLAKKCVCGKREQDYGTPESNFQLIADLWNQYLFKEPGAKEVFGIGPMDVSMMMALMKIARIRNGGGSGDSFVDLAGYAACGGEIWHSNKEIPGDSSQETN